MDRVRYTSHLPEQNSREFSFTWDVSEHPGGIRTSTFRIHAVWEPVLSGFLLDTYSNMETSALTKMAEA